MFYPNKRSNLIKFFALMAILTFVFVSCGDSSSGDPTGPGGDDKTVTIPAQSGTPSAGIAGSALYYATTENIADGKAGTVTWYASSAGTSVSAKPAGLNDPTINTVSNTAYFTLITTAATPAGTYYFRVTIDGTQSNVGILTVSAAKTITIPAQSGTLTAGTAGNAIYYTTTANIADGKSGTVTWYTTLDGTSAAAKPAGLNDPTINTVSNTAYFTLITTAATPAGTYYFRVTIDGTHSNVGILTIL